MSEEQEQRQHSQPVDEEGDDGKAEDDQRGFHHWAGEGVVVMLLLCGVSEGVECGSVIVGV